MFWSKLLLLRSDNKAASVVCRITVEKSSLENSIPALWWILTIFANCAVSHLYKTIKGLLNQHKQTQRGGERENPRCVLCIFLNFRWIWLMHSFCPWRHHFHWWHRYSPSHGDGAERKLPAVGRGCQRCSAENTFTPSSTRPGRETHERSDDAAFCLVRRFSLVEARRRPLQDTTNHSEEKTTFPSRPESSGNALIPFEWLWDVGFKLIFLSGN